MNETLDVAFRAAAAASPSPGARTRPGPSGRDADLIAEELLFFSDPASGLRCIIAIDPADALPALGACSLVAGLDDLRALLAAVECARRTTRKLLLAQLPCAGAHAVLRRPPGALDRPALFAAFGRAVSRPRIDACRTAGVAGRGPEDEGGAA
jgi:leucine dehydrogenase